MRYIFYADVYFIQNFMMKVTALYLSLYLNKKQEYLSSIKGLTKLGLVSMIGTVFEIVGLLLIDNYNVFLLLVNVLEIPVMIKIILGKEKKRILNIMMSSYFFTMLINSVLEVLWNLFGERGSYLFYILFSCGVVIVGVRIWRNYTKMKKGVYYAELSHKGNKVKTQAFYDSGNCLKDSYTGKGVHIVSEQILTALGGVKKMSKQIPVYVVYQSLGNEQDLLEVYYIDELMVDGEKGRITIHNCPVGVTKDNLFEGKNYEIILNEEVF